MRPNILRRMMLSSAVVCMLVASLAHASAPPNEGFFAPPTKSGVAIGTHTFSVGSIVVNLENLTEPCWINAQGFTTHTQNEGMSAVATKNTGTFNVLASANEVTITGNTGTGIAKNGMSDFNINAAMNSEKIAINQNEVIQYSRPFSVGPTDI